jgi:hypothetical protein
VGIKSLKDLANSTPQKVAEALNIPDESANILVNVAKSLIKAKNHQKT